MARHLLEPWPIFDRVSDLFDFVKRAGFERAVWISLLLWAFLPENFARDEAFQATLAEKEQKDVADKVQGALEAAHITQKLQEVVYAALVNLLVQAQ